MSKLQVTTEHSVWVFDEQAKTYTREPIVEGADHPSKPYVSEPVKYWFHTLDFWGGYFNVFYLGETRYTASYAVEVEEIK